MVLKNRSRCRFSLLMIVVLLSCVALQGQNVEKMMKKEMGTIWSNVDDLHPLVLHPLTLDSNIGSSIEDIHQGDKVYKVFRENDSIVLGYLLSTSAPGRFDEFDYFVIYNELLEVELVRISVYRSSHGSAICSKRWLKQFSGFKGGDIVYGKDVQAVSGATISGSSIVEDIKRSQRMMAQLKQKGLL